MLQEIFLLKRKVGESDMPGKYTPPPHGNLPSRGVKILNSQYEGMRKKHPDWPKERCAKEAWYVVEQHGFKKINGVWVDTHSPTFKSMYKEEKKEHNLSKKYTEGIVADHIRLHRRK